VSAAVSDARHAKQRGTVSASKRPATLKPDDALFIPGGAVHAAKNVGNRNGAKTATDIVEEGKPLFTDVGEGASR
jgi:quercetin dioxygenase-like cupin family protein